MFQPVRPTRGFRPGQNAVWRSRQPGLDGSRAVGCAKGERKGRAGDLWESGNRDVTGCRVVYSHSVSVGRRRISSSVFVVATGTRPSVPDLPGLATVDYLTNETLYDLERLPHSLIILGGGVDGLEIASALRRLGVDVTVVEMAARLLNEDAELFYSRENIIYIYLCKLFLL